MLVDPVRYSKILIVDDSPFTRAAIKKTLIGAKIGSGFYEAGNGREAISQYITHKPNLVIMDIIMPDVDGVRATQAIRKYDPNAKIIVISAKENKETVDDAIRAGAKNYVLKPLEPNLITMSVSKYLMENSNHLSSTKEKTDESEIQSRLASKLFQESFSAIDEFNEKSMQNILKQLDDEKKLSRELNGKLTNSLTKIAGIEVELIKKKNDLEMELDQKTKQLIQSERFSAIGELSSRLAHDLRNPLAVIKATIDLLKQKSIAQSDTYTTERLELVSDSIFRMTHQIDGVLDYVRKTPITKETHSLRKIIQNSLIPIKIPANVTIILPENDIMYKCDSIKMDIVFGNLFLNSIQAIGKEQGQIIIKIGETANSVIMEIQDSGKGVENDQVEQIFEPLFTTKQEGTGLGLSSVKSIVEQHKGTITFRNNPSTFTMTFPKELQT
ncbi:Signal transduction histidine kinase [Candidatus Nitrosarchaeum limnium SFB1]|jgi:signal transduction histidine kinase/AmiR/NasT family two-component response regulator|uniref:Signal transduction histidine kinase n=1 Tax=Candidatus Nitrosarchaeum limnium SFB1 TaxID=886738 RepID=F3KJX3_9ARCH|nr:Signal transduction histidine kinase [Candidatus Nitrosarchaeum limnium SFB1]